MGSQQEWTRQGVCQAGVLYVSLELARFVFRDSGQGSHRKMHGNTQRPAFVPQGLNIPTSPHEPAGEEFRNKLCEGGTTSGGPSPAI